MKYSKIFAHVCVAAILLASCKFDGTTPDYTRQLKNQGYETVQDDFARATYGEYTTTNVTVQLDTGPGNLTNETRTVSLIVSAPFRVDVKTLVGQDGKGGDDAALAFYRVTGTETNTMAKQGAALPYEQKTVVDAPVWQNTTTTITLDVNFSSITEGSAIYRIDATKLKDIYGNLMLNENYNNVVGEEADGIIRYLNNSVDSADTFYDKDTAAPFTSVSSYLENLSPFIENHWNHILDVKNGYVQNTSDSKYTGAYYIALYSDTFDGSYVNWTKVLNKIFTYEILKPGETTWEKREFSFKMPDSSASIKGESLSFDGYYYAVTEPFLNENAGTKIRIFRNYMKLDESDSPAYFKTIYGHPAVWGTTDTPSRAEVLPPTAIGVYTKDPGYVVNYAHYSVSANKDLNDFFKDGVPLDATDLLLDQATLLWPAVQEGKWPVQYEIGAPSGYYFTADSVDGFMLTDKHNRQLATIGTVSETHGDKIVRIRVKLDNEKTTISKGSEVKLWAGRKVQCTNAKTGDELRTMNFGKYKDAVDGDAAEYVPIENITYISITHPIEIYSADDELLCRLQPSDLSMFPPMQNLFDSSYINWYVLAAAVQKITGGGGVSLTMDTAYTDDGNSISDGDLIEDDNPITRIYVQETAVEACPRITQTVTFVSMRDERITTASVRMPQYVCDGTYPLTILKEGIRAALGTGWDKLISSSYTSYSYGGFYNAAVDPPAQLPAGVNLNGATQLQFMTRNSLSGLTWDDLITETTFPDTITIRDKDNVVIGSDLEPTYYEHNIWLKDIEAYTPWIDNNAISVLVKKYGLKDGDIAVPSSVKVGGVSMKFKTPLPESGKTEITLSQKAADLGFVSCAIKVYESDGTTDVTSKVTGLPSDIYVLEGMPKGCTEHVENTLAGAMINTSTPISGIIKTITYVTGSPDYVKVTLTGSGY